MADLEVNIDEGVAPIPETIESLKEQIAVLALENAALKREIDELEDQILDLEDGDDLDDDDDDDEDDLGD